MKIGIEVEGRFRGERTLFCQASELQEALRRWNTLKVKHKLTALYVSDHDNLLTDDDFTDLLAFVTSDCNRSEAFRLPILTVENLTGRRCESPLLCFMVAVKVDPRSIGLCYPGSGHPFPLSSDDQVKFTCDRFVATTEADSFDLTSPDEFEADIEIASDVNPE